MFFYYIIKFQDDGFPSLSGARIVRIATHPNYQRVNSFLLINL